MGQLRQSYNVFQKNISQMTTAFKASNPHEDQVVYILNTYKKLLMAFQAKGWATMSC